LTLVDETLSVPGGPDPRTLLITLDPERDTPAVLEAYVKSDRFPARLQGLTGSRSEVDAAKRAFHVFSSRSSTVSGDYMIDHSSYLYVLDERWRTVAVMPTVRRENADDPESPMVGVPAQELAACIAAGLEPDAAPRG
jgi:protein SCO1/2